MENKIKAYMREYYKKNRDKIIKQNKEYYEKDFLKNPEKYRKKYKRKYQKNKCKKSQEQKKAYKENPFKFNVRSKTTYHIKIPLKQMCEICKNKRAVDRHHFNYFKPFEVKFLCRSCHIKLHRGKY